VINRSDPSPLVGGGPSTPDTPTPFPGLDEDRIDRPAGAVRDLPAAGAVPVTPRRAGTQGLRGSLDRRSIGGRAHP